MIRLDDDEHWNYTGTVYVENNKRMDLTFSCKKLSKNKFIKLLCSVEQFQNMISYGWVYPRLHIGSNEDIHKLLGRYQEPVIITPAHKEKDAIGTISEDGVLKWL